MVLSELLPPSRVERCFLLDKAWPPFDWEGPIAEHHISDAHIYTERTAGAACSAASNATAGTFSDSDRSYFHTWPIPLSCQSDSTIAPVASLCSTPLTPRAPLTSLASHVR